MHGDADAHHANIDEDLLAAYKRLAAETHHTLGHVIQDALREALTLRAERGARAPITLTALPEAGGLVPGIDLSSHAALTEALEKPEDDQLRRLLERKAKLEPEAGAGPKAGAGPEAE